MGYIYPMQQEQRAMQPAVACDCRCAIVLHFVTPTGVEMVPLIKIISTLSFV